jgi:hypothetical protein
VAVGALERGLSVLSETAACRTLAQGVALIEAAERSTGIYMFAENYPYIPFSREMRRRYGAGDVGEVRYAEAEYLDAPADLAGLVARLDNGAVLKSLHGFLEGSQPSWVRICGDRGLMENLRQGDTRTLRVVRDVKEGEGWRRAEEVYRPWPGEFPPTDADPLGDGVAETLMLRDFADAVRHRTPPDQDVYFGVELSITGIQAMRSSLASSAPVEVPDLRDPDVRRAHAGDDWFPDLPAP